MLIFFFFVLSIANGLTVEPHGVRRTKQLDLQDITPVEESKKSNDGLDGYAPPSVQSSLNSLEKEFVENPKISKPSRNLTPPFHDTKLDAEKTSFKKISKPSFLSSTEKSERRYSPSVSTKRSPSTRVPIRPFSAKLLPNRAEATNELRSYLPPQKEYSAAAQTNVAVVQPANNDDHHHDHHHGHHHGENFNICEDAFHSFLCAPLKARKRITGEFPSSLRGQSSFINYMKLLPNYDVAPSNTFQNAYLPPKPVPSSTNLIQSTQKPFTTRAPAPSTTVTTTYRAPLASEASNDRFYLPPVFDNKLSPAPSNQASTTVKPAPKTTTTSRPIPTAAPSSERPLFNSATSEEKFYLPPVLKPQPTASFVSVSSVSPTNPPRYEPAASFVSVSPTNFPVSSNSIVPASPSSSPVTSFTSVSPTHPPVSQPSFISVSPSSPPVSPASGHFITVSPSNPPVSSSSFLSVSPSSSSVSSLFPLSPVPSASYIPFSPSVAPVAQSSFLPISTISSEVSGPTIISVTPISSKTTPFASSVSNSIFITPSPKIQPTFSVVSTTAKPLVVEEKLKPSPVTPESFIHVTGHSSVFPVTEKTTFQPSKLYPSTKKPFETTFTEQSSNQAGAYLPPDPNEPAAAQISSSAVAAPQTNNPFHHGRDLCTDPFHSFLCVNAKPRKRITGELPSSFNPQASTPDESKLKPEPSNQDENKVRPDKFLEPAPAQNLGYKYPKPVNPLPTPSSEVPTSTGYSYPKPEKEFPLPSQQDVKLAEPPTTTTRRPEPTTYRTSEARTKGYFYPKPDKPFPLPAEQPQVISTTKGYSYPKPQKPFPLPTEQNPQPDFTSPTKGYQFGRPEEETETKSKTLLTKNNFDIDVLGNLGSADFIPVNKLDFKRSETSKMVAALKRFGERQKKRQRDVHLIKRQ